MMKNKDLTVLIIPLVVLIFISEVSLIAVTLMNQNSSAKQRNRNRETTLTVLRESYSNKCLLLIPNAERNESNIDRCDKIAETKVKKLKKDNQ